MLPPPDLLFPKHLSNILSETVSGGVLSPDDEITIAPVLSSLYVASPLLLLLSPYYIPY